MTKYKVQNLRSLREEMKAVARGELVRFIPFSELLY